MPFIFPAKVELFAYKNSKTGIFSVKILCWDVLRVNNSGFLFWCLRSGRQKEVSKGGKRVHSTTDPIDILTKMPDEIPPKGLRKFRSNYMYSSTVVYSRICILKSQSSK